MGTSQARPRKVDRSPTRSIADALFSRTQQRVFSLLFGQPERAFATSELISLAGSGSGAVQRELQRLLDCRLLVVNVIGRQKCYQANPAAPIFQELRSIIEKTACVPGRLREALVPLRERIEFASLYGSLDTASDRINVLVVSDDAAQDEVLAALQGAERELSRRVELTLYTQEEFHRRRQAHSSSAWMRDSGHIVLIGSEASVAARQ